MARQWVVPSFGVLVGLGLAAVLEACSARLEPCTPFALFAIGCLCMYAMTLVNMIDAAMDMRHPGQLHAGLAEGCDVAAGIHLGGFAIWGSATGCHKWASYVISAVMVAMSAIGWSVRQAHFSSYLHRRLLDNQEDRQFQFARQQLDLVLTPPRPPVAAAAGA